MKMLEDPSEKWEVHVFIEFCHLNAHLYVDTFLWFIGNFIIQFTIYVFILLSPLSLCESDSKQTLNHMMQVASKHVLIAFLIAQKHMQQQMNYVNGTLFVLWNET